MTGFEQTIRDYLTQHQIPFSDSTDSLDRLDFSLTEHNIHFDVKEKKQHFAMANWPEAKIPEEHFFILDDLAARKILLKSPRSFLFIRDCTRDSAYVLFSVVDLLCMPRRRVRRKLGDNGDTYKGKWYIDLRHGTTVGSLDEAIRFMTEYPNQFDAVFKSHIDCWRNYEGEDILTAGTPRRPHHWTKDLHER